MSEELSRQILQEIKVLKNILAKVLGMSDSEGADPFSNEAIDKAAKDFQQLSIERGEWVEEDKLSKYLKSAPYRSGSFIRKEFKFTNWVKNGRHFYYSKKDLILLNEALQERNVALYRYEQMLVDKAEFDKSLGKRKPVDKKSKSFVLPKGVRNITTSDIPKPDPELVRQDLAALKKDFQANKYGQHIDVYNGIHAMLKSMYYYEKYLEPKLKNRCKKWCYDFNYANHALKLITGKEEKFVAHDPTQIEL